MGGGGARGGGGGGGDVGFSDGDTTAGNGGEKVPKKKSNKRLKKEAEEKARMEEEERELVEKRKEKRKQQRAQEAASGENTSGGAIGTGDVWTKDNVTDVVRMVLKQKERVRKIAIADAVRKSGLSLLTAARSKGVSNDIPRSLLAEMDQYKGVKRLSFVKKEDLEDIVRYDNLPAKTTKDKNKNSEAIAVDSSTTVLERKKLGIKPTKYDDVFIEYPYRPVTELSTYTNMKMMNVSDPGLTSLAKALMDDITIERICISHTHVTCAGIMYLAEAMPTIAKLGYLNLSGNAIADIGGCAIARALEGCLVLKELNIGYNRIGHKGCQTILRNVLKETSSVNILSIVHNKLTPRQSVELRLMVVQYNTNVNNDVDDLPTAALPLFVYSSSSSASVASAASVRSTVTANTNTAATATTTTTTTTTAAGAGSSITASKPRFSLFGGVKTNLTADDTDRDRDRDIMSTDATNGLSIRQLREREPRLNRKKQIFI